MLRLRPVRGAGFMQIGGGSDRCERRIATLHAQACLGDQASLARRGSKVLSAAPLRYRHRDCDQDCIHVNAADHREQVARASVRSWRTSAEPVTKFLAGSKSASMVWP